MDIVFLVFAFVCGVGMKTLGLPPLVGYLCAGFILHFAGFESNPTLQALADLGITLMLFTIGLKLNLKDLIKTEVWIGGSLHMLLWVLVSVPLFMLAAAIGVNYFSGLELQTMLVLCFAMSFSSTVCVVKILEESGESKTRHGKIALGILVLQDIFAVLYMALSTGQSPSVWALLLLLSIPCKPLLDKILDHAGHGELLPLTGFLVALGSYELFTFVGIKGDLGALLVGMLFAQHVKSGELSKALLSFKDMFLIGFFLNIGFSALPTLSMLLSAVLLCLLLVIKFLLFFFLFTRLKLRVRTAYLCGLIMSNYSEFGLIVGALSVSLGLLDNQWLVVLALTVSISFIFSSIVYKTSHDQYNRFKNNLKHFQHPVRLAEDQYPTMHNADILIVGMGRVGMGAFSSLSGMRKERVWGMDADTVKIRRLQEQGLQVINGDGEDIDLWENLDLQHVKLVLIALPSVDDTAHVTQQLAYAGFTGKIAAIARYEDEVQGLLDVGVDKVFNFFTEAGTGFAEESLQLIDEETGLLLASGRS
ncbi:cation:proton antiporter family protein [Aestuariibacter salexigens]|uniref:cation:proton antiporter family protein n=1 Tax=Aestuariibacter salexigens TaxID=226010 RepID=UPI0003FB05C4|nr:cation:proton antiporter family protein [Aestuariibacter salexigens]